MFDCADVEMRELLPELAAGTLDDATRARVERHLAFCAECTSELETLRLVRSAYAASRVVDVRRIVAALPKPAPVAQPAARGKPVRRWIDWRIAAALTMISVGGLSFAIAHRRSTEALTKALTEAPARRSGGAVAAIDSQRVQPVQTATAGVSHSGVHDTTRPVDHSGRASAMARPKVQLAFAGGVDDMDDASIKVLLGALDEMDRAPVAPSAEPDSTPVLPVIKPGQP